MSKVKLITENMLEEILNTIEKANAIYMMPSFVMQSGVRLISSYLKKALDNGVEVKCLTGDYLFVTQPEGLKELLQLDDRIEVRLWRSHGIAFHPKSYLFETNNGNGKLIIGSSNLSRSALTHGVEWNLSMDSDAHPQTFEEALDQFMKYFYHEQTIPINQETLANYKNKYINYHQANPNFVENWTELEEIEVMFEEETEQHQPLLSTDDSSLTQDTITPRPAQKEALDELAKTIDENYDKAMIVMATGLGKTYLAGFFAKKFKKVLFIAHREEILYQAQKSFRHIMSEKTSGLYNGRQKDLNTECLFASIYTLSIRSNLEKFSPEEFDLIIVDEFHHAAANSYQRVLNYFNSSFLLGITATPDRLDNKDVYAICDGNVAYQLHFLEAIEKGWLSPFHYHGIYDETDYSQIRWLGSRYDEEALLAVQLQEKMAKNIFQSWKKFKKTRTIGFCSSIRQANFLREYFIKNGIKAVSLHSGSREYNRREVIHLLEAGEIDIVFTVDLFNEGVDIPSVDTLLFVRPTESLAVFTQQIG
jgi:superfamily II DNA or RNA helicase/HKD family nuclease